MLYRGQDYFIKYIKNDTINKYNEWKNKLIYDFLDAWENTISEGYKKCLMDDDLWLYIVNNDVVGLLLCKDKTNILEELVLLKLIVVKTECRKKGYFKAMINKWLNKIKIYYQNYYETEKVIAILNDESDIPKLYEKIGFAKTKKYCLLIGDEEGHGYADNCYSKVL